MRKATFFQTNRTGSVNRWVGLILLIGIAVAFPVYAQQKPPAPATPQEEPPKAFTVEPGFIYTPKGRIDPFVNPTPPPKPPAPPAARGNTPVNADPTAPPPAPEIIVPVSRPRGLKGLMLEDISLKGVVVAAKDPAMTMAIIQGPGNKTYNVSRKDELFNAVIKDIRIDSVIFTPTIRKDDAGEPLTVKEVRSDTVIYTKPPKDAKTQLSTRDVVRKLHPAPGESK